MSEPLTIGEKVARDGPSALFMAIADLAAVMRGPGPIGEWGSGPFLTDGRYRVYVNGGSQPVWTPVRSPSSGSWPVPRFHAVIECDGWAIALVHPGGGQVIGADEDELIAAVTRETAALLGEATP